MEPYGSSERKEVPIGAGTPHSEVQRAGRQVESVWSDDCV